MTAITVELIGDKELIARLDAMPNAVQQDLARAVTRLGLQLQRKVQADKLSGQVLRVRTGALRSSINTRIDQGAASVTATVGTNIRYAAAHEFGIDRTVGVKASLRRIKQAFGRPIAEKTIAVRAHPMHMRLPERSFLRSALADMQPAIEAGLKDAVAEAVAR